MATRRVGAWLIGAKGGVATTMLTGLVALARRSLEPIGLVTATVPFAPLELVDFADIIVGGHDIRSGSLAAEAERMWTHSRAISPDLLASAADVFAEVDARLRPGTVVGSGERIHRLPRGKRSKRPGPTSRPSRRPSGSTTWWW